MKQEDCFSNQRGEHEVEFEYLNKIYGCGHSPEGGVLSKERLK